MLSKKIFFIFIMLSISTIFNGMNRYGMNRYGVNDKSAFERAERWIKEEDESCYNRSEERQCLYGASNCICGVLMCTVCYEDDFRYTMTELSGGGMICLGIFQCLNSASLMKERNFFLKFFAEIKKNPGCSFIA